MKTPFACSFALHGVALLVALGWFAAAPAGAPAPLALQVAAMEFVEPEASQDECLEAVMPEEEVLAEFDVVLPQEFEVNDTPAESCDLPACDFAVPRMEPTALPDIPLNAATLSRPRPVPTRVAAPAVPRARPTAARPVARRSAPRRARSGRPLRLVHRPNLMSYYPPEARRRGVEGEALVEIRVDARGVVVDAKLVRSSGSALLDRAALRVLYDYRFAPGAGGRSRVPVNFRLG